MRRLRRVDRVNELRTVKIEDRLGLALVNLQTLPNGIEVRVIKPVFLQSPPLQPLDELIHVRAAQVEDAANIQGILQYFGLMRGAGNAVEHERVLIGLKAPGHDVF